MVRDGQMLEHAHVFGNFYGSPRAPVQDAIEAGHDVLFDIDWQGAQQVQNSALGLVLVFNFFDGLGGMAILVAWWGVWHIVAGLATAFIFTRRPLPDAGAADADDAACRM